MRIFSAFLLQMLPTVGAVFVFGFVIYQLNRLFYANFGAGGRAVCYATGFVGTPVHELSHALMCLLFLHRINEIRLFQISDDGTLGYVNHAYNERNIYQQIGNFFIGVAPILCISAILYIAAYKLLPSFAAGVQAAGETASARAILTSVKAFFASAKSWRWWVFVAVGMLLALHMNLSTADIKGAWSGLLTLLVVVAVVDTVLYFVAVSALDAFTAFMLAAASYMICFFAVALILSLFALVLSFLFRLIFARR